MDDIRSPTIFDIKYQGQGTTKQVAFARDIYNRDLHAIRLAYQEAQDNYLHGLRSIDYIMAWREALTCRAMLDVATEYAQQEAWRVITFRGLESVNGVTSLKTVVLRHVEALHRDFSTRSVGI